MSHTVGRNLSTAQSLKEKVDNVLGTGYLPTYGRYLLIGRFRYFSYSYLAWYGTVPYRIDTVSNRL